MENPKDSIRKLLGLISEFSKVAGYEINTQKALAFLYANNEKSEREIKESIPFITATKRIKYLGINLPKETKELYTENYKTLMKEIKDDINRWSDILCSWVSSVQLLSHARLFTTPWTAARQAPLSITNSQSLLKLMSIELVMPSTHLILCRPLLLLPSIFPSIRVIFNESVLHIRWPNHWSFSFSISPSNEYSGLISFRMDWFDLLAVQGTLKSLLQHQVSKTSILRCLAFFIAQFSHPYMTIEKTIALTRWTFVSKVMSLLFNMNINSSSQLLHLLGELHPCSRYVWLWQRLSDFLSL